MASTQGYKPQLHDDPRHQGSWGLYSEADARWLPVIFATFGEAREAGLAIETAAKRRMA